MATLANLTDQAENREPDQIPEEILKGECLTVKGIGAELITRPVAEVPISYQGWKGVRTVGVAERLPVPCFIGIDLTEYVKSVLVQTHAQQEEIGKVEDMGEIQTELVRGEEPTAESVPIESPLENTLKREQSTGPMLYQCISVLSQLVKVS